ncbi:MAG: hypothetical protein ACLTDR_08545 [Adlercreutzia equolifaciens]
MRAAGRAMFDLAEDDFMLLVLRRLVGRAPHQRGRCRPERRAPASRVRTCTSCTSRAPRSQMR